MKKSEFKKDCELVKDDVLKYSIIKELKNIESIVKENGRFKELPLTHAQLVNVLYDLTETEKKNL